MIVLNRIDGSEILVNSDEIETAENNHDTTITLKNGKKVIVKQSFDEIISLIIEFRKLINKKDIVDKG